MNHKLFKSCLAWIFLLTLLSRCGKKMTLTESELRWINAYNGGDTLVFQSSRGELDTTVIVMKEVFNRKRYSDPDPDPVTGIVWYRNKKLNHHPDGHRLVSLSKSSYQSNIAISYLYSTYIISDLAKPAYADTTKRNIYEFDTFHPGNKVWQPKKLFWHREKGLIKYITNDDVVWRKIN